MSPISLLGHDRKANLHSGVQIALIFIALQLPSLRALSRYFPEARFSVPLFLALALCGTALVIHPPRWLAKVMSTPWPTILLLIAFTIGTIAIYPYADGLKVYKAGSDADDALILAGQALLKFQNPYTAVTYLGNPLSPGPGWALLAAPFSSSALYSLFFPSTLALALATLWMTGYGWVTLNRFMILLASSLGVWELAVVGSDYLPFVMLTLTVTQLLERPNLRPGAVAVLTLVLGLLSTFRIVFIFLPLLVGFSLFAIHRLRAITVALGSLVLCAACQLLFFLLNRGSYPPLELLQAKAGASFNRETLFLAVLICALTGIGMLVNWRNWRPITHLAIGLTVPWTIVAIANLVSVRGWLPNWGGATFLALPLPFLVFSLITKKDGDLAPPLLLAQGMTKFTTPQRDPRQAATGQFSKLASIGDYTQ